MLLERFKRRFLCPFPLLTTVSRLLLDLLSEIRRLHGLLLQICTSLWNASTEATVFTRTIRRVEIRVEVGVKALLATLLQAAFALRAARVAPAVVGRHAEQERQLQDSLQQQRDGRAAPTRLHPKMKGAGAYCAHSMRTM